MTKPLLQERAPDEPALTDYDRAHFATYLRLLDAAEAHADWRDVAAVVFGIDPVAEAQRAEAMHTSHLERARWISRQGYRDLVWRDA